MASQRSSLMKPLVCVSIVLAMLLLADVTTADKQLLSPDLVAGFKQQTYLRGNTNGSSMKKGAVVTEEMHVGDPIFDSIFFGDYSDGKSPSANCRHKSECPRKRPRGP